MGGRGEWLSCSPSTTQHGTQNSFPVSQSTKEQASITKQIRMTNDRMTKTAETKCLVIQIFIHSKIVCDLLLDI
jgi:hypothetical protein